MEQKDIAFAVCGFGRIGQRHARIISGFEGARLNGVIDTNRAVKENVDNQDLDVPFFTALNEFVEVDNNETDVINICTPNGWHAPLAVEALNSKYHVVIEKPMALSKSECEEILNASLKNSRSVFIVKQNRYSPPSKLLKSLVAEDILGDIYTVQINCYWNRDDRYYKKGDWHGSLELDGGTLFTQFSHFVDIMYWVFGDVENISVRLRNFSHKEAIEFEDTGMVHFDFKKGGVGCINYSTSCWDRNMESSITVIGSKGSIKIGGQYMDQVEYCHIKDYELPELEPTNPPNEYGPYTGSAANHHYVIENVVNTLQGKEEITTNAVEGMKVVEIIEKIYRLRTDQLADKVKA